MKQCNTFLQDVSRIDPEFELERIEIAPDGADEGQISIVAKVRRGFAPDVWEFYAKCIIEQ